MLGFRVWDSVSESFLENGDGLLMSSDGRLIAVTATGDRIVYTEAHRRFQTMQSTGLRDANDVEIFEEDLIKSFWKGGREFETIHVQSASGFLQRSFYHNDLYFTKVLGNAMEHPELLEKIK